MRNLLVNTSTVVAHAQFVGERRFNNLFVTFINLKSRQLDQRTEEMYSWTSLSVSFLLTWVTWLVFALWLNAHAVMFGFENLQPLCQLHIITIQFQSLFWTFQVCWCAAGKPVEKLSSLWQHYRQIVDSLTAGWSHSNYFLKTSPLISSAGFYCYKLEKKQKNKKYNLVKLLPLSSSNSSPWNKTS